MTTLKARVARWVACVVAVGACVVGVCAPTYAVGTPVPTPSVPVTTAPETPLLPNHGIVARVVVEQLLVETSEDTREWAMRISIAFTHTFDSPEKITPGGMSKHRQHLLVGLSRRLLCQG